MSKLTEKEHWDAVHDKEKEEFKLTSDEGPATDGRRPLKRRILGAVKRILGKKTLGYMSSYSDYLLWEVILKQSLPDIRQARVLEVGSAPGDFLARFSQRFDCVPFGVEYSEPGVQLNKKVFSSHGLNPDNVILADFLSAQFQKQYESSFDVVISRGFIEHFTDVQSVVEKHLNVLAEGGHLIIYIPNLSGINYALTLIFDKDLIPLHNLKIMRKAEFLKLFNRGELRQLFCDYYGTFSFYLLDTKRDSLMRHVLKVLYGLQPFLNLIFRLLFKRGGVESRLFSPYLLFIGKKEGT